MAEPDGKVKQLARELAELRTEQDVRLARVLVVIASVALFLVVSMGWYAELHVDYDLVVDASGWDVFSAMVGFRAEGVFVFAGYYSWVVVLAALAGAVAALRLTQRWICVTFSTLLTLLAFGHLLVAAQVEKDFKGQQLAAAWAAIAVMFFAAIVWGHLYRRLYEQSPI